MKVIPSLRGLTIFLYGLVGVVYVFISLFWFVDLWLQALYITASIGMLAYVGNELEEWYIERCAVKVRQELLLKIK